MTVLTNGRRATRLPRVFYDDYNRPTRNSIVNVEERPVLGERVILRDFDGEFQSECVVVNIKTISAGGGRVVTKTGRVLRDSGPQLFIELKQVGDIEYL